MLDEGADVGAGADVAVGIDDGVDAGARADTTTGVDEEADGREHGADRGADKLW